MSMQGRCKTQVPEDSLKIQQEPPCRQVVMPDCMLPEPYRAVKKGL